MLNKMRPDKQQAIHQFFSQFGVCYEENAVPEDAKLPYNTYSVAVDNFDSPVAINFSIWERATSWASIAARNIDVEYALTYNNIKPIQGGYIWFKRGTPFAQQMTDASDEYIKRMYYNIEIEYLTAI